jgi:predicted dehydrogenase
MDLQAEKQDGPDLKVALIGGAAGIAMTHLRALAQLSWAKVVGLSDINSAGVEARAREIGCASYTDHGAMLAETRPDIVTIVTPHPFHAPIALDCFEAGAHVLVEKPIAVEAAEADRMIAGAEAAGRILAVNFQQRFRPAIERAKAMVDEGAIGPIVRTLCVEPWFRPAAYYRSASWRGTWRGEGGGVLMNQAPHTIDLLCHLAGMPAKIWGWTRTLCHEMECEDSAQAMLEYPNGAPGYIYVSTVEAGSAGKVQIVGDLGALEVSGSRLAITRFEPGLRQHMAESQEMFSAPQAHTEVLDLPGDGGGHLAVYRDLHAAIVEGRGPRIDGREGLMSLELANAMILSSHVERAISLPLDRAAYAKLLDDLREGRTEPPRRQDAKEA